MFILRIRILYLYSYSQLVCKTRITTLSFRGQKIYLLARRYPSASERLVFFAFRLLFTSISTVLSPFYVSQSQRQSILFYSFIPFICLIFFTLFFLRFFISFVFHSKFSVLFISPFYFLFIEVILLFFLGSSLFLSHLLSLFFPLSRDLYFVLFRVSICIHSKSNYVCFCWIFKWCKRSGITFFPYKIVYKLMIPIEL